MPPSRVLLAHPVAGGVWTPGTESPIGHTGGFTDVLGRDERGTTVAPEEMEESESDMMVIVKRQERSCTHINAHLQKIQISCDVIYFRPTNHSSGITTNLMTNP